MPVHVDDLVRLREVLGAHGVDWRVELSCNAEGRAWRLVVDRELGQRSRRYVHGRSELLDRAVRFLAHRKWTGPFTVDRHGVYKRGRPVLSFRKTRARVH